MSWFDVRNAAFHRVLNGSLPYFKITIIYLLGIIVCKTICVFDIPVSDFICKAHLISTHMCFGYRWHVYFLFTCYFYSKHKHVKIIPTILTGLSLCILTDDKHPEVDFHCSSCFPGSVNPPPSPEKDT